MQIEFHGAAGTVTGSCYLVKTRRHQVLIDCGLFQGASDLEAANRTSFGFDPAALDCVLLTHAHLDHCGRLPLLVQQGFRGEILATSATRDLVRPLLLDAAGLQSEEMKRSARQQRRRGEEPPTTTFDELDVFEVMDRFGGAVPFGQPRQLNDEMRVTFGNVGHILGAAWVLLEVNEEGETRRLLVSGDVGNREDPLLQTPMPAPHADLLLLESTYGDRPHKALAPSVGELKTAILDTLGRGGNVIIPTFAVERAQVILYFVRELIEQGALPRHLNVFLDSPLAISVTQVFRRHMECLNPSAQALFAGGHDPFNLPGLRFTRDTSESRAINEISGGAVILAGSGMATGGRVLHHLRHNLWREASSVVFVGYASQGTLARAIIDGQRHVRIYGEDIRVAAHVYTIGGFSAHAGQNELLDWSAPAAPKRTFLVHGEDKARQALAELLRARGGQIELPELGARYAL